MEVFFRYLKVVIKWSLALHSTKLMRVNQISLLCKVEGLGAMLGITDCENSYAEVA